MTTADDLAEIKERLDFALSEIAILEQAVKSFSSQHVEAFAMPTPGRDTIDLYIRQTAPVPTAIKSRAGTTANEIRACLDGLACVLAVRNGKSPSETYFPISRSLAIFEDDGMRKIRKLSEEDKAKIVSLKPYREENSLLFGLHEADRTRKHTRLATCGAINNEARFGASGMSFGGGVMGRVFGSTFDGVYVADMTYWGGRLTDGVGPAQLIASGVPRELPVELKSAIAYADPPDLAGLPVVESLKQFAELAGSIVSMFSASD